MAAGDFRRPEPADTAVEAAMRKGAKDLIVESLHVCCNQELRVANERKACYACSRRFL